MWQRGLSPGMFDTLASHAVTGKPIDVLGVTCVDQMNHAVDARGHLFRKRDRPIVSYSDCKNNRISTDIFWRVFQFLTEPVHKLAVYVHKFTK